MARAQGARAQIALAYETVYGTPPISGFRLMPFARTTLGSEQPLLESELLGYGRDPLTGVVTFAVAPASGIAITAGFEFDVPVRFDTDTLDVTLDFERLGSITSIPLIEVRR